jgi:hypothetical protein
MPSAISTFKLFNCFVENAMEKVHNLQSDTLKIFLTNGQPYPSHSLKSDITEIAAGHGYVSGGMTATVSSSSSANGLYKLILNDVSFTATGGTIVPFRCAVLYNDTQTTPLKPLIGWWDYGQPITLGDGEPFILDLDNSYGILTIS